MAKTHYEVLGVSTSCTAAEIRSAYRKLVLLHHPDRSSDPKSKTIFLSAAEAYEVLGDEDLRKEYDARLKLEKTLKDKRAKTQSSPRQAQQPPSARLAELKLDVNRLNAFVARGNYTEAEKLARSILDRDPRQSVPYFVLGDIARMSGQKKLAIKMYAYAVQYDPRNPIYQRRYDELADSSVVVPQVVPTQRTRIEEKQSPMFAPLFGLGLILIACVYLVFAKELPVFPDLSFISTWTVGIIAMLFFSGVVLGSCMSLDGLLSNFQSMASAPGGRITPTVALATIAIVNFWAAVAMYVFIGLKRRAFDNSTSRVIASVVVGTCLLAFAAEASGHISGFQVFAWGGNLVYLGAICGWMVSDALRSAGE